MIRKDFFELNDYISNILSKNNKKLKIIKTKKSNKESSNELVLCTPKINKNIRIIDNLNNNDKQTHGYFSRFQPDFASTPTYKLPKTSTPKVDLMTKSISNHSKATKKIICKRLLRAKNEKCFKHEYNRHQHRHHHHVHHAVKHYHHRHHRFHDQKKSLNKHKIFIPIHNNALLVNQHQQQDYNDNYKCLFYQNVEKSSHEQNEHLMLREGAAKSRKRSFIIINKTKYLQKVINKKTRYTKIRSSTVHQTQKKNYFDNCQYYNVINNNQYIKEHN